MADYSDPKRATAYRFTLSLYARSDNQIKTAPTLAAGDVKVSKDNGATANITTLPAETPASSGILQVDLSATEMTADLVTVIFRDAAGAEWNDVAVNIAPSTVQMADLATAAALTIVDDFLDTEMAAVLAAVDTEVATIVSQTTAANIRAAVGLASANLDTQLADLPTNAELATALGTADDAVLAQIALVKAKTDNLPTDPADASVIAGRFDTLDISVADLPTNAELTTALGTADDAVLAQVALVKAKTDSLTFTVAGQVDANLQYVNDVLVTGTGAAGDEWGP